MQLVSHGEDHPASTHSSARGDLRREPHVCVDGVSPEKYVPLMEWGERQEHQEESEQRLPLGEPGWDSRRGEMMTVSCSSIRACVPQNPAAVYLRSVCFIVNFTSVGYKVVS